VGEGVSSGRVAGGVVAVANWCGSWWLLWGGGKGKFSTGVATAGEYHAMLGVIFCWNGEVGLGKPKPHHLLGWTQGKPLCKSAGGERQWPRWPS